jgi:hypothetical protein
VSNRAAGQVYRCCCCYDCAPANTRGSAGNGLEGEHEMMTADRQRIRSDWQVCRMKRSLKYLGGRTNAKLLSSRRKGKSNVNTREPTASSHPAAPNSGTTRSERPQIVLPAPLEYGTIAQHIRPAFASCRRRRLVITGPSLGLAFPATIAISPARPPQQHHPKDLDQQDARSLATSTLSSSPWTHRQYSRTA